MVAEYYLPIVGLNPEIKDAELHLFITRYFRKPQPIHSSAFSAEKGTLVGYIFTSSEKHFGIVKVRLYGNHNWEVNKADTPNTLVLRDNDAFEILDVQYLTRELLQEHEGIQKVALPQEPKGIQEHEVIHLESDTNLQNRHSDNERTPLLKVVQHHDNDEAPPLRIPLPAPPCGNLTRRIISDPFFTDHWKCNAPNSKLARFIKGAGVATDIIWPIIFYSLFIHDFIVYATQPENRYGNTIGRILVGFSPNEISLASMLGSDLPSEWQFWPWWILLAVTPLITGFLSEFHRSPAGLVYQDYPYETLDELRSNAPYYNLIMSDNYLLWARGYKMNTQNCFFNKLYQASFWLLNSLIYYADLRIIEIFLRKFVVFLEYEVNKYHCHSGKKIYQFMPEFGNYECGVCPDWPFVYIGDIFTSQGCINGLLSQPRSPEFIVASLKQLQSRAKPYFQDVDLTQQNWTNWLPVQWEAFLNQLGDFGDNLRTLNLSTSVPNINYFDDGKISYLADFTQQVQIEQFDISNQGIGPILTTNLTNAFNFNGMVYLALSGVELDNGSFLDVVAHVPQSLQTLIVSNNRITDYAHIQAVPYITNSSIKLFDMSYNLLTDGSVPAMVAFASQGQMNELDIAGNDFSNADFTPFWSATTSHNHLVTIHLGQCNINDGQLVDAAPYLANSSIKNWGLQNNQFSDFGANAFFTGLINSTATRIDVSGNAITDDGITSIAGVLPETELDVLVLSDCSFTTTGLATLAQSLWNSTVDTIVLSGNFLGDDGAIIMANALLHKNNLIKFLDISRNQITDVGGKALAPVIKISDLEVLILNNNLLTCVTATAIAPQLPGSSLRVLGLNQNQINATGANAITSNMSDSALTEIDLGNNPINAGVTSFAENLIQPIPNENDLSNNKISLDQARYLNNYVRRNTNLTFFNVAKTNMSASDARVICRVLNPANISINNAILSPNNNVNPSQVNLINCRLNQNSNGFFNSPTISSSAIQSRAAMFSAANISSTFMFSMMGGIVIASAIMSLIALAYVIHRAIKRNDQADDQQNLRRTGHARNSI